ncbi:MAG: hypothetical protein E3J72_17575 [Planctomycetota bacterium]|nr:MAG: hypothetical protein E3J72_17575 [Planctomycetota bacterium]
MACPIIDDDRHECKKTLTLQNVDIALSQCGNVFHDCPVFLRHFKEKTKKRAVRRSRRLKRSA